MDGWVGGWMDGWGDKWMHLHLPFSFSSASKTKDTSIDPSIHTNQPHSTTPPPLEKKTRPRHYSTRIHGQEDRADA